MAMKKTGIMDEKHVGVSSAVKAQKEHIQRSIEKMAKIIKEKKAIGKRRRGEW